MKRKERGERIRRHIVDDVRAHPADLAKHIGELFGITPQAVNHHVQRLEQEGWLTSQGIGKGKRYFLGDLRRCDSMFRLDRDVAEDVLWRDHFAYVFEGLAKNTYDICHFSFTEMVNNVLDHSGGTIVSISAIREKDALVIIVIDDGEGIFRKIKRLYDLPDERQALFELSKGKLTTDPEHHSGEGIFFTSRLCDAFVIESKGVRFCHDATCAFDVILETGIAEKDVGTAVYMRISRHSAHDIQSVFDEYAGPDEYQFTKTVIPVRLAQYENEMLVSRSEAKRLLLRIDRFKHVIFDFDGVAAVGQAFADEIFRVYARAHPDIVLLPLNMVQPVEKMVKRAIASRSVDAPN
jgi:anti-sigma regulatory factor (Ser/Thr protein kinase)